MLRGVLGRRGILRNGSEAWGPGLGGGGRRDGIDGAG